jgi:winged helix DNA-binding protein
MTVDRLDQRALNRATLARQHLLRRSDMPALEAVEHLVGLQAQVPLNPYTGLWSRLERFRPETLAELLLERRVVRLVLMRATLHLVSADDCLRMRPLVQPVLDAELARHRDYAPALAGVDLDTALAFARGVLAERPRSGGELRAALAERFPRHDAAALAYACRNLLALVQVPPRGVWGRTAAVALTTAESWLGRPLAASASIDDLVLRYLAAFGPAATADVAAWSGLAGMHEVVNRLRPRLRPFRDDGGRELFDLPDAPRPDPQTTAPPRFLPEYDNALLSHRNRSRFLLEAHRGRIAAAFTDRPQGAVLVDGFLRGSWRLERDSARDAVTMVVSHAGRLSKRAAASLGAEGRRFARFLAEDAAVHDVRLAGVD